MPFSVSEVVNDPDLAQAVTIFRTGGNFGPGGWVPSVTQIPSYGIIQVASGRSLEQVPEGDRVTGSLEFHSAQPIHNTSSEPPGLSDQIQWRGHMYRVITVSPWNDFGYQSAILVRILGS